MNHAVITWLPLIGIHTRLGALDALPLDGRSGRQPIDGRCPLRIDVWIELDGGTSGPVSELGDVSDDVNALTRDGVAVGAFEVCRGARCRRSQFGDERLLRADIGRCSFD